MSAGDVISLTIAVYVIFKLQIAAHDLKKFGLVRGLISIEDQYVESEN